MAYKWTPGSRISGDADTVGEQLEQIREAHDGRLKALDVVRAASKARRSALGKLFEWDDKQAATKHREEYARYVMRSIMIVQIDPQYDKPIRAFIQVYKDDASYYTSTAHVMADAELREQVLAQAHKELLEWQAKYRDLEELASVFAAIDKVTPTKKAARQSRHRS